MSDLTFDESGTRRVAGNNSIRALIDAGVAASEKTPIDRTGEHAETATLRIGSTGQLITLNLANDTIAYEGTETAAAL